MNCILEMREHASGTWKVSLEPVTQIQTSYLQVQYSYSHPLLPELWTPQTPLISSGVSLTTLQMHSSQELRSEGDSVQLYGGHSGSVFTQAGVPFNEVLTGKWRKQKYAGCVETEWQGVLPTRLCKYISPGCEAARARPSEWNNCCTSS